MKAKYQFCIIILVIFMISCAKIMPAGFWTNFKKEYITSKFSDQGPWGGLREIYWKNDEKTFSAMEIIDFASKNGWQLTDSIRYSKDSLYYEDKNNGYMFDLLTYYVIPKHKTSDSKIYVFKTGIYAVEPGNLNETDQNGFVVIDSSEKEFSVYHIWGE